MASDLDIVVETASDAVAVSGEMLRRTGVDETVRLMRERALGASSYQPGMRILEPSDADADDELRTNLEVAAGLGAPAITVSTGVPEVSGAAADELLARRLARVSELAGELGVMMALEPVHPILRGVGHIHTVRHAAEIAGAWITSPSPSMWSTSSGTGRCSTTSWTPST